MVEERHEPGDSYEAEKQWRGDPEDDPLSVSGAIRSAICFRIATPRDEIKLPQGKPEKHKYERNEDRPVWLQGRKIADPRSTDSQTQKQKRTYTTGGCSDTGQHSADERCLRIEW